MKIKTNRFAVAAAILLALCLVFVAPVGAEAVTVSTNEEFKANVTQNAETIVINLNADVVIYDTAAWDTNALGGDNTKTITINGNGHTLTFNQTNSDWSHVVTKNESAILILNNVNITNIGHNNGPWNRHDINFNCTVEMTDVYSDKALAFKNSAKLTRVTITENGLSSAGTVPSDGYYAIWIQPKIEGQTIILDDCSIIANIDGTGTGRGIKIDNQYVNEANEKKVTLTVKNTVFNTEAKSAILVKSTKGADITLENVDISNVAADSTNPVWVDEDAAQYAHFVTVNGGSLFVEGSVAKIDNAFFETLGDAVAEAKAGETITLLKDVELGSDLTIDKSITLDLNSKKISGAVGADPITGLIKTTGDDVTIKNGEIYNSANYYAYGIHADSGELTLENVNLTTVATVQAQGLRVGNSGGNKVAVIIKGANSKITAGYALVVRYANASLIVNDGLIASGASYGISGNGAYGDNTEITINGGTITGTNAAGIYHPQDGTLTINGGKIVGSEGIQFVGSGNLVINGGDIIGTNADVIADGDLEVPNDGAVPSGAALSIIKSTEEYGTEPLTVSITGGTFTSTANDAIRIFGLGEGSSVEIGATKISNLKFITGGTFSSNPSAYIAPGMEVVQPGDKYLVQKYVDRSSSSSSSSTTEPEEPEQPEEPVVEPETPAAPGEVASSTEVTDGGEVAFETTVVDDETGEQSAPAAADSEIKGVVLPTGTEGTVEFVPVSEQPAPAGQEENTKRVFEINVPSYKKGEAAVIKFQMTVAELAADGKEAADVALWHFDEETGEWTKLVTSYTIVDGVVYFEAITEDFSPFAIIYEDEPAGDMPGNEPQDEPETPASPAPVLGLLAALGAAVVLRRK